MTTIYDNLYERYLNHPTSQHYINYFEIKPHECDLLWVIDAVVQTTLPLDWESDMNSKTNLTYFWKPPCMTTTFVHPMDLYFLDLTKRLRLAASNFEPKSAQYKLTLNPPNVIKDVL